MSNKKNFSIKPKFIQKLVMLQSIVAGVTGGFMITALLSSALFILSAIFNLNNLIDVTTLSYAIFIVSMIFIPMFLYEIKRKTNALTYFDFYDEYIDFSYYVKPFMNRKKGRLYFKDVSEMIQHSNFYQNFLSLKTIQLHAPETSLYEAGQNFVGIQIEDIEIGKGKSEKIQDLLDKWRGSGFNG